MRDHSKHIELSRDEAVRITLEKLTGGEFGAAHCNAVEQMLLENAYGRVLAEDIHAKTDIPNVLTCAMDSVAVRWADFKGLEKGALPDTSVWTRGVEWQFANTGVAMPEGFDTAIVIEHVIVSDDEQHIEIDAAPSAQYAGTRAAGSTMKRGALIIEKGTPITPDVAARIASAGYSAVLVYRMPRVSFLPTGNELVPPDLPYAAGDEGKYAGWGHVFESNSFVVKGKVEAWGGMYVPFDIICDEYEAIRDAVERAAQISDIVVLNAGSSKGSDDWSVEVLEEMGEIICHQTNHGPGHHSSLTIVHAGDRMVPVVGISGPAGGASFTLDFYLRPLIKAYMGLDPLPHRIPCKLKGSFGEHKHARKNVKPGLNAGEKRPTIVVDGEEFFAVRFMMLEADETGQLYATPLEGKAGSPKTQHANALYMLRAGADDVFPQEGAIIEVELR